MAATAEFPVYREIVKFELVTKLNRVIKQVQEASRLIEADQDCLAVLRQLFSAQAAMRGVSRSVLRTYLEGEATEAIQSGDSAVYDELMDAICKFAR